MRLRKSLLAVAIAVFAIVSATVGAVVVFGDDATSNKDKPNIIYFLVDDMSADLLPYMDTVSSLADGGTKFDNYFVSNSLCCTSRATMFTGQHPHNSGVLGNTPEDHGGYEYFEPLEDETYAKQIQDTGDYHTAYLGKYLNGYKMKEGYKVPAGWDEWHVADGGGYNEYDYKLSEYTGGDDKPISDGDGKYLVDLMADRAVESIDRSRDAEKSFFVQVAPFSPHSGVGKDGGPRFPPAKRDRPGADEKHGDCGKVDCADLDVTKLPGFNEDTKDKPDWVRQKPLTDKEIKELNRDFRNRARMVQSVDDMVEKVTKSLSQSELDNTYIMFGSDNGFHLGQHRLMRGKTTAYDHDVRTPFLVKRPGSSGGDSIKSDEIVQNVDLYPTLIDIANGDEDGPTDRDGRSLRRLIDGEKEPDWRNAAYVEHYKSPKPGTGDPDAEDLGPKKGNSSPPTYDAIRTAQDLLVDYKGYEQPEFYDLDADPYQLDNKPDDPRADELKDPLADLANCGKKGHPDCWEAAHIGAD
ncbi:sulfatase-like hydrolase/transferase [Stackebrandtia nassauensis]|uniref:Sulfatase n=1 Tax=Stackebrandtia nassauensis (strain DSM 44728 / CIP 108903 / NRRL B-16338 / NBRC 102104 / LLR-40K-21) TaxID=446470 RepID=D3PYX4_STANL|nr:sulfatase-like hydrolase/transferase [Stackebrandtia nassauensis]ADD43557.1 sulfatase [Stackebrandtia nassauensis DSM 44728]